VLVMVMVMVMVMVYLAKSCFDLQEYQVNPYILQPHSHHTNPILTPH
jgi:hypothetical protein